MASLRFLAESLAPVVLVARGLLVFESIGQLAHNHGQSGEEFQIIYWTARKAQGIPRVFEKNCFSEKYARMFSTNL